MSLQQYSKARAAMTSSPDIKVKIEKVHSGTIQKRASPSKNFYRPSILHFMCNDSLNIVAKNAQIDFDYVQIRLSAMYLYRYTIDVCQSAIRVLMGISCNLLNTILPIS